ncbi:MAG: bifunctional adenosylcobinamide kinase/adenosylcobinamide-phosphate guanylyltransferase [Proteobacteria bacterium]|nr:bifunctional adenosylcobinamide kinase/adenosylcobinamide-phosphate guanylyltransferase [Desulfobacula sp.]MBU3951734.1 bifunctional adenosylcobinamide kinase/adenosylcobinamide-phosphate guanylyltransferase [Pseudomonadota bacterium]MBU4133418.1 bifunctional adenosylcobinamide kinase/adenosylcobinamide-phosphate guanylyltransferase [Pseudomonadota bacterium]
MENRANITLVIGGCRSGKSSFALEEANQIKQGQARGKIFLATSVPTDPEMDKRVRKHREERGEDWLTIEEPVMIHKAIEQVSKTADVILVDCLTLWTSNLLFAEYDEERIMEAVGLLTAALEQSFCPVFLVSNEVGYGIVPDNFLARQFRDLAGLVNQKIAAKADRVFLTVAGIALPIKPQKN